MGSCPRNKVSIGFSMWKLKQHRHRMLHVQRLSAWMRTTCNMELACQSCLTIPSCHPFGWILHGDFVNPTAWLDGQTCLPSHINCHCKHTAYSISDRGFCSQVCFPNGAEYAEWCTNLHRLSKQLNTHQTMARVQGAQSECELMWGPSTIDWSNFARGQSEPGEDHPTWG